MLLQNLRLTHFKNYQEAALSFDRGMHLITGVNGSGKTNLLDSIYFLCMTKSAFNYTDNQLIMHEEPFFHISAEFEADDTINKVVASVQARKQKVFTVDTIKYDKLIEHIGRFPVIMVNPYDQDLIREGSEERRKFMDFILSQTNQEYLIQLIKYNKTLKQRNELLKQSYGSVPDATLLDTYDEILLSAGKEISKQRQKFVEEFKPVFEEIYASLGDSKEEVAISYKSHLNEDGFEKLFRANREKDCLLQRTEFGIHKDDLVFRMNENLIKKFGSQGQQKTFVLSLKLAQHQILKTQKGTAPILLLDDVFDKLDDERIEKLIKILESDFANQIFITDARKERSLKFFSSSSMKFQHIEVANGEIQTK